MSKEILVNFNQDMVRAILDGSKTQTRRPLRNQSDHSGGNKRICEICEWRKENDNGQHCAICCPIALTSNQERTYKDYTQFKPNPRFQPGDIMCVRERARLITKYHYRGQFKYEADGAVTEVINIPTRIKPIELNHCVPNGCFKELVRIKRKVVRVWFERIKSITDKDILAEGVKCPISVGIGTHCGENVPCPSLRLAYHELWESIYPGSWERNDWVECIEFDTEGGK